MRSVERSWRKASLLEGEETALTKEGETVISGRRQQWLVGGDPSLPASGLPVSRI